MSAAKRDEHAALAERVAALEARAAEAEAALDRLAGWLAREKPGSRLARAEARLAWCVERLTGRVGR